MDERIEKVKNDIETFLKDSVDHQNKHIDYILVNPETFVEALNKNGGFDSGGNLQYAPISKAAPDFKYVGNVNLREKSRQEKLATISEYFGQGYYLTAEVKGATKGSQHWVTITGVDSVNVLMVEPASNQTIL